MSRNASRQWWTDEARATAHEVVVPLVRKLRENQTLRKRMDLLHLTLYADRPIAGLGPYMYAKGLTLDDVGARLNVCKSVTDSYVAMITRSTPKPMAVTNGADWSMKRKAKGMNKWLDAVFKEGGVRTQLSPKCARLSAICGDAIVKVYADVPGDDWKNAKVGFGLTFKWDFHYDDAEAQDPRNIRQVYETHRYDKAVLTAMFPGHATEIASASSTMVNGSFEETSDEGGVSDLVEVYEGYHLRSSATSTDGYKVICIQNATLYCELWESDRFPYAVLRRAEAPMGFDGIGIPEELRGMQGTINEIAMAYEEAIMFFARPKWTASRQSRIQKAHLDDQIGTIIEHDGAPPVMQVASMVMPSDVTQYLWAIWQKAHDQIGVPQMFANGSVPAGFKSGKAIEEYNDTSNARFGESLKLYEQFHLELAELAVDVGREIAKHEPKFASTYVNRRLRELIYFKDIDPGKDKYTLDIQSANGLASTPSARFEQLDMMLERGLIDQTTFRMHMDMPDIESETNLMNAPYEIADRLIERFLDAEDPAADDVYMAPDPDWNLEYIRARFQYASALAFLDDAPEGNLALLRKFADQCQFILQSKAPPPAPALPPGAMPPGAPPAMPAPMPQAA